MLGQYNIYIRVSYIYIIRVSYIYIILPQHLNFHYFSLFMTKIHTTVIQYLNHVNPWDD